MTMPVGTTTTSTSSTDTDSVANMAGILSTLRALSTQGEQLVKQGATLQANQEQMSRELAEVRKTGEAVEKRVLVMETRQEERDKAQKQIDQVRTDAKSDLKDTRQGWTDSARWAVGILVTLLAITVSAVITMWTHYKP